MSNETVDVICKGCGEVFTAFLAQMAQHNSEVVCPRCGNTNDCTQPPRAKSRTAVQ